jgi:hypothetical protein
MSKTQGFFSLLIKKKKKRKKTLRFTPVYSRFLHEKKGSFFTKPCVLLIALREISESVQKALFSHFEPFFNE